MEQRVQRTPPLSDDGARLAELGNHVYVDTDKLIESRLLVQANSGGGKSYAIRKLCEVTYGHAQQLVLDVEGEFHTLRQKFDYVLAGQKDGDCPATVASAALLARRLLELGASAIIDIYELGARRAEFVARFLESLMSAPRALWHPVIIVVDEANKFCPEGGKLDKTTDAAANAVIDLMTRGRKRGFCGVLATQRLSALNTNAAAECNNVLIGRCALDVDLARAAVSLGLTKGEATARLKTLEAGRFYVQGPAFVVDTVQPVRIGAVVTDHPKAGQRALPAPPVPAKVKAMLAQLANLPEEAAEEAKTVDQLRARVRDLELSQREQGAGRPDRVDIELQAELSDEKRKLRTLLEEFDKLEAQVTAFRLWMERAPPPVERTATRPNVEWQTRQDNINTYKNVSTAIRVERTQLKPAEPRAGANPAGGLGAMARTFLTLLAQRDRAYTRQQILILTSYRKGGSSDACFRKLLVDGHLRATDGGQVEITLAGLAALGSYERLPQGAELREQLLRDLPAMEGKMLGVACLNYPHTLSRPSVLQATGYRKGGSSDAAFRKLVMLGYLTQTREGVRASEELFS